MTGWLDEDDGWTDRWADGSINGSEHDTEYMGQLQRKVGFT